MTKCVMLQKPENIQALSKWLAKPAGVSLLELECQRVGLLAATMFGYDTVILGLPEFNVCLQQCPIKRRFIIDGSVGAGLRAGSTVSSRHDKLAIATESIDLVYIAHSLEFSNNPYEVLLEAYRILRPDGHLIISMFNPLSLFGLWHPFNAKFMSSVKLKDWLGLLGFDIMQVNHFGYYVPELSWLERYSSRIKLPFGAAYVVEASKKIASLTPIKPVWSAETVIANNDVSEPTT